MSPFDISVMLFFIVMLIKIVTDTIEFWREFDEEAEVSRPAVAPRHLPAPSRPSPKTINPAARTAPAAMPAKMEPIRKPVRRTVRPATVAQSGVAHTIRTSAERSIKPVSAPIKRKAAASTKTVA